MLCNMETAITPKPSSVSQPSNSLPLKLINMHTTLRTSLASVILGTLILVTAQATPQSFDFKDPKGVNNIQFKIDAPLETTSGIATGISGNINFDLADPAATTGTIVLDTKTLTVGNPLMQEHLHSATWLDVAQYPTITFAAESLANIQTKDAKTTADVTGQLTVKGITKQITVPVSFTYLADKLGARLGNDQLKGDLLVMRASLEINRNDFNIQPGKHTEKVAENIQLSLAIAGAAARE